MRSRKGSVFHVSQSMDGHIKHKLTLQPVLPHGWMIYIDGAPGYGARVMSYKEANEHLNKIKTMIIVKGACSPGSASWVHDEDVLVEPIQRPADANASSNDSKEDKEDQNMYDMLPTYYALLEVATQPQDEEVPVKEKPTASPSPKEK